MNPTWRADAPANLIKLHLGECLVAEMDYSKWTKLGLLTDAADEIRTHPRLLRSLSWGDDDYEGCVLAMLPQLLGELPDPQPDPWGGSAAVVPAPLTLAEKFPNLDAVAAFVDLPVWLAERNQTMFRRLFDTDAATMPDGTVLTETEAAVARLEVGEMRRQVDRIRRDLDSDPEAAVGQAKELVESACKTILGMTGMTSDGKEDLPKLVTRTLRHLGLDASQMQAGSDAVQAKAAQRMLGGVSSVLNGANELRNARGTGHGRSGSPLIDPLLAKMTVGLVLPTVVFLIETYEGQTDNTDTRPDLVIQPAPIAAPAQPGTTTYAFGSVIAHDTFGEGQVTDADPAGGAQAISVDFGEGVGVKRLLTQYAPLRLVRAPAAF